MESGVWVQQQLDDILVLTHCPATMSYVYTPRMMSFVPPPLMMPPSLTPWQHFSTPTLWPHFPTPTPRAQFSAPTPRHMHPPNPSYRRPHRYEVPPRIRARLARMASAAADASFDHNDAIILPQQDAHSLNRRVENTLSQDYISDFLLSHRGCLITKEEIICTICQDEINEEEEIVTLNCKHIFHADCIKNWLIIKNQCANCRALVIQ